MSLHGDLLKQARHLATREPKKPLQASLRRAVSSAYYALFHLLVDEATKRLVSGNDRQALRHVLSRAFGHADMKQVCAQFANGTKAVSPKIAPALNGQAVQPALQDVASAFVDVQQARHEADYDLTRRFTRQETLDLVDQAEQAVADWKQVRKSLQADVFLVALVAMRNMRG